MSRTTVTVRPPMAFAAIADRLDRMPITPMHRRLTAVIGVGLLFDTYENNLSGTISKVLQGDFSFGGTTLKLVIASAFLGQFVGAIVLGRLADRIGRRRAFLVNLALYSGFSLLGAFAPNAGWLIATRFLAGVGIGAEQTLSDCYLADVLPASQRGRFTSWAYTLAYCGVPVVGFAALWLVPLTPLGIAGWRWLFVIGSAGSALVWIRRRRLIESPRWLASRGRIAEAERLLERMEGSAADRGRTAPAAAAAPVAPAPTAPAPAAVTPAAPVPAAPAPDAAAGAAAQPRPGLRLIFEPEYRRRTAVLWAVCVLSVVGYYGFGSLAPLILAAKGYGIVQGLGYTALSFLGYPVGSALTLPLVDRVERRVLIAVSACLMTALGMGFALVHSSLWLIACGFGYTLVSNVFSNGSHVYMAEQYPTSIRSTAAGLAYSLSKLSAGVLPFALLPVLTTYGAGPALALVGAAMALLALLVATLAPRSTGTPVDAAPR
ncbi:MFS transporter [Streptomyces sp. SL13]|uniref:MFS transporter n=1 Tax=Streptantibioticus silvisoli TaxID=2705255 RepID=A0AA90HDG4_9ACTN|nr:MFS transporter [Streptantibioticus silvisoli]MDI5974357.1 MFS transporter [Streptantibioticus silvisoli]